MNTARFTNRSSALHAIGPPTNNEQFSNNSFFAANFTNVDNEGVFQTFSDGVLVVPAPSSMILLGSRLMAVVGVVRRRVSR